MIEHIVLLKTKRPLSDEEKGTIRSKLMQIPGVLSFTAGENYTKRGLEYNTGIVVRITTKEAEAAYQTHPIHIEVRDTILKPLIVKGSESTPPILAVDYECPAPVAGLFSTTAAAGLAAGILVGYAIAKVMR